MKQTIGEFLATLRKAKGFTQEDVADKLNISNRTLSSWETDRTTPDALILPAIADLYDVTVDEILRGEKINCKIEHQDQLSEKAKRSIMLKKYGKFTMKHFMFTGFGLLAVVLNVLGFIFLVYSSISEWVGITLTIIGFCALITLTILLIYFERSTLLSEGIISDEPNNEHGNSLALILKHKVSISFCLISIPYIIFGLFTLVYLLINSGVYTITIADINLEINRTKIFIAFIVSSLVIGLSYLVTGIIYGNCSITKFGNAEHIENHKKNKKLFFINGAVCLAITLLFLVPAIVFSFVSIDKMYESCILDNPYTEIMEIHTSDFELFRKNSQTLIIDETKAENLEIDAGKYVLELPEGDLNGFYNDVYQEILLPLGNNFYARKCGDDVYGVVYLKSDNTLETVAYGVLLKIYHNKKHSEYDYVLYLPRHILMDEITYYIDGEPTSILYDNPLLYHTEGEYVGKNYKTGKYGYYAIYHYHVEKLVWTISAPVFGVTYIVCLSIYFKKRKKQTYKI